MTDYDVVVIGAGAAGLSALRLVGDDTVHALCAVGPPSRAAEYVRALRAAGWRCRSC